MHSLKLLAVIVALSAMTFTLTNCSNKAKDDKATEQTVDKSGPEYTSAYVCPMHCKGSGGDEPGECPICGMKYVKNEDYKGEDEAGDAHEGHDHGEAGDSTEDSTDHSGHDHD